MGRNSKNQNYEKDGQIGFNEFHEGLKKLKSGEKNDQLINSYFSSIDTDKNGKIDKLSKEKYFKRSKRFINPYVST